MSDAKLTFGQAIDQILAALASFEEDDKRTILSSVCSHLKISVGPASSSSPGAAATTSHGQSTAAFDGLGLTVPRPSLPQGMDIKALKEEKQPKSAREMAAVVAFYLGELADDDERKQTITTSDLEKYFKQAGFKLPEKLEQLLVDAKKSGYFDSVSRGEYKLTRVGYNLVAHNLPGKKT